MRCDARLFRLQKKEEKNGREKWKRKMEEKNGREKRINKIKIGLV